MLDYTHVRWQSGGTMPTLTRKSTPRVKTLRPTFNVEIIERDSWDPNCNGLLELKAFRTAKQAEAFITKHNSKNTATVVPEYYTYARMQGGGSC